MYGGAGVQSGAEVGLFLEVMDEECTKYKDHSKNSDDHTQHNCHRAEGTGGLALRCFSSSLKTAEEEYQPEMMI